MSSKHESDATESKPTPGKGGSGDPRERSLGRFGRSVNSGSRPRRVEIMTVGPSQMKALKRRAAERAARKKAKQTEEPRKENE